MPELPDLALYIEALQSRIIGATLKRVDIAGPFLLRTFEPPPGAVCGQRVASLTRVGKRIAIGFENGMWLALHLMIAGRLHWFEKVRKPDGRRMLAAFAFDSGCLTLTEAGSRKRAALFVLADRAGLSALDPGGLEVMESSLEDFSRKLLSENHTIKRALTDPHLFAGIGNAYSDEILHRAQLSPVKLTSRLAESEIAALHSAIKECLTDWIVLLRKQAAGKFPEKVTAFHEEMAVHGRYGQLCPRCGEKVQRIRHASNESNYCPRCQTGGKLLADRALSRLLREDWPRTAEELEERRAKRVSLPVLPS